jgi:hypothetical protein
LCSEGWDLTMRAFQAWWIQQLAEMFSWERWRKKFARFEWNFWQQLWERVCYKRSSTSR